jgi:HEAT repeat protein
MKLLADTDPGVISCALVALGHLGIGDPRDVCLLATHESPDVRHAVAYCLGGREEPLCVQTLVVLSSDPDEDVRDWATFGLAAVSEHDSSTVVEALIARLADADDDVRLEALCGLAARGHPRAAPLILDELGKAEVHSLALEAAAECGDPRFLVLLKELLDDNPDDEDVLHAIECCTEP